MHLRAGISFVAVGLALLAGCKEKKALVVLRNSMPTDITVTLDHRDFAIGPRQAVPVELPPGDYELTATGLMLLQTKNVSLRTPADTVIYNVGGGADLALVNVPEGGGENIVRPITAPITTLEAGEVLAKPHVDELLPKSPSTKAGVTSYYLCSYEPATKAIGCKPEK